MAQHQMGVGAAYTKSRRPVQLVFAEEFQRIDDAFQREKQIQGWSRAKRRALMERAMDALPDLAHRRTLDAPRVENLMDSAD